MMLTIFTPTYNRAKLLNRLHNSLLKQQDQDFEWLIVDDGSTDDTEYVVRELVDKSPLSIVYHQKPNEGKHSAHNEAVELARGEWFLCVDSDDMLAENAVETIRNNLYNIHSADWGFAAYKSEKDGSLLCNRFPRDTPRRGMYQWSRCGAGGEYAFVFKTALLKERPYPVITAEKFMGECVLYDRLELAGYTVCPLDEVLEICEYQPDGLSSNAYRLLLQNPTGYQIYHAQRIDLAVSFGERLRHCICYQAFRRMSGNRDYLYQGRHRWLTALARLPGAAAACYYRFKGKGNL